jgi:ubiquinol-cytochrome c reductase cytochrome b subunit/cytochrome b6
MSVRSARAEIPGWLRFLRQRVPVNVEVFEELSKEPIPNHMRLWWYCLGGTPLMLLAVQAVTGILLTFYYVPSPAGAWDSVRAINEELPYGWWIRSIHHWASHLMIIAVVLHMARVFFTGAYRRPRELNWIVGAVLLFLTLGFAFTGYALVYDQLSYWAATVGINIAGQVPLAGPRIAELMRGGPTVGGNTLTRFFVFHVGALPSLAVVFLGLHVFLLRVHGVMELDAPSEVQEKPLTVEEDLEGKRRFDPNRFFAFFPDHVTTELLFGLFLLTAITLLAILLPADLGPRANPAETPLHIRPEWYFYPVFRWLKVVPGWLGISGALAFAGALVFWPFIEAAIARRRPGREDGVWIGAVAAAVLLVMLVWEALS